MSTSQVPVRKRRFDKTRLWIPILLIPYLVYVFFIIRVDQGAIDYETFMAIGQRLLHGQPVWLESSYYPMPFVIIFAFLSMLPRALSMLIWHLGPILLALWIMDWNPLTLLFGPLFGNMIGGQSAVFAMMGLWGYRKRINEDNWRAGFWLGILLLKPHLGIFPIAWACVQWVLMLRRERRISKQALGFLATAVGLYAPGFLIMPDWTVQWQQRLGQYNPIILRTVAGFVPRTLLYFGERTTLAFWIPLITITLLLFAFILFQQRGRMRFDVFILWSTIVSPLVHDYDLIQLVPLLDTNRKKIVAALLSIPHWLVILLAYTNDQAWFVVTFIPLGLLAHYLFVDKAAEIQQTDPSDARILTIQTLIRSFIPSQSSSG
jgi:hypothetical protein